MTRPLVFLACLGMLCAPALAQERVKRGKKGKTTLPAAMSKHAASKLQEEIEGFDGGRVSAEDLEARLLSVGHPAVKPILELIETTRVDQDTRLWLMERLPAISPRVGEKHLRKLLKSKNDRLPPAAFSALAKVGTAKSLRTMIKLLRSTHLPTSMRAARALIGILEGLRPIADYVDPRITRTLRKSLEQLLDQSAKNPKDVRHAAILAMPRVFGPESFNRMLECMALDHLRTIVLKSLLCDEIKVERFPDATFEYGTLNDAMHRAIRDMPVRDAHLAMRVLSNVGDVGTVGLLLEFLDEVEDPSKYERHAFYAMRKVSHEAFTTRQEWDTYWEEVGEVYEEYEDLLVDVDEGSAEESVAALEKLKKIRDPRLAPAIEFAVHLDEGELFGRLPQESVVLAAIEAIGFKQQQGGARTLIRLLGHPFAPKTIKKQATWALGRLAGKRGPQQVEHWLAAFPGAVPELEQTEEDEDEDHDG